MSLNSTPAERTQNLLHYFGWQGGTIHQLSDETGVSVQALLYEQPNNYSPHELRYCDYIRGALANETCVLPMRLELAKQVKGNHDYWIGVACAVIHRAK